MALVIDQGGIFTRVFFEDNAGDVTSRAIQMKWDTDLTTTLANALAHAVLWAAVTKAGVQRTDVVLRYTDTDAPDATSENNEVAHVALKLTTASPALLTQKATLEVPAPIAALHLAASGEDYNRVDTTNAALLALYADFEAAGNVYISHGQNAEQLSGGYIHHKASKLG